MALEDIEKLKEKVARDPNSKLFVPLADEYRKVGMLDEAIAVLLEGLNNQPSYLSARVALGKIYLEKKLTAEAKEEFEKVVSSIPDNLFAQKKLAEIYRDSGDKDRAISAYRAVLKLNPLDEDAVSNLEALQTTQVEKSISESQPVIEEATPVEEALAAVEEAPEAEEVTTPAEEAPQAISTEEFERFKKSIEKRVEGAAEEAISEEAEAAEEVIAEKDMEKVEKEASSYVEMFKEMKAAMPEISLPGETSPKTVVKEEPIAKPGEKEKPLPNIKDAERFIAEGNYTGAMKAYRDMLSIDPGNKQILQKAEELRMLLKMLGKEHEETIGKLEAFGEGIRKRKDEFLKGS